jgi:ankyrin repeat protein
MTPLKYAWAAALVILAAPALAESPPLKKFFDAALYGSVADVRRLVEQDKSLTTARDPNGFTVLHIVATEDRPEVQRLLLQSGADPNAVNDDGASPLHIASYPGFAALLLRHGARVNLATKNGDTPLHSHASERDSAEVIRVILKAGGDRRLRNRQGQTAFDIAKSRDDAELMRLLKPE